MPLPTWSSSRSDWQRRTARLACFLFWYCSSCNLTDLVLCDRIDSLGAGGDGCPDDPLRARGSLPMATSSSVLRYFGCNALSWPSVSILTSHCCKFGGVGHKHSGKARPRPAHRPHMVACCGSHTRPHVLPRYAHDMSQGHWCGIVVILHRAKIVHHRAVHACTLVFPLAGLHVCTANAWAPLHAAV